MSISRLRLRRRRHLMCHIPTDLRQRGQSHPALPNLIWTRHLADLMRDRSAASAVSNMSPAAR